MVNPYSIYKIDNEFYVKKFFKFDPELINKFCNMKEKSNGRNFYSDDFYVVNKNTIAFKNKIPEYFDPVEFENNILSYEWCPQYAEEFLSQYIIEKDKITVKDKRIRISDINWWYFPIFIKLEKVEPNYKDYFDPMEIVKTTGNDLDYN